MILQHSGHGSFADSHHNRRPTLDGGIGQAFQLYGIMERSKSSSENLEASLLQLIYDHHQTSLRLREHTEKAKKDAIKNAVRVSDVLLEAVNGGVQECYINQKRIEVEIRALTATIIRFAKQIDYWLAASHALNTAIKEIGDFENWMKTMEFDCKSINAAICNIHSV